MQIQHESNLIEQVPIKAADLQSNYCQSLDGYTLRQPEFNSIEHLACNSNQGGALLAVYSRGFNQITLLDTRGTPAKRDRFSLKPCDKRFSRHSFLVKGMDFSPDGTKLAVGQSDCIIYIYKIVQQQQQFDSSPADQGSQTAVGPSKPVISGKFVCSSPVTCLIWTEAGIVFGTRDGKVKLISLAGGTAKQPASSVQTIDQQTLQPPQQQQQPTSQTKVITLYTSLRGSLPVLLSSKYPVIAVGFADGSLQILAVWQPSNSDSGNPPTINASGDPPASRRNSSYQTGTIAANALSLTIEHGHPPSQLALVQNNQLCCASSDGRLTIYGLDLEQAKWTSHLIELKEAVISLDYSPTNDIIALATRNRLSFVCLNSETNKWQQEASSIEFHQPTKASPPITLTCLRWLRDGNQLAVGTQLGGLELFRCSWNKQSLNDKLDICHIAKNRVRITDRERNLLATYKTSYDIKRVNLFDEGQNVLIWTTGSLLMARLGQAQSEVKWRRDKAAGSKFCFHPAGYVLVLVPSAWELSLVKLGQDSIYFSTKLDSQTLLGKSLVSLSCFPHRSDLVYGGAASTGGPSQVSPSRNQPKYSPPTKKTGDAGLSITMADSNNEEASFRVSSGRQKVATTAPLERLALATNGAQCLSLIDLRSNARRTVAREAESGRLVWLELSCTGKHLAWRNSKSRLTLLRLDNDASESQSDARQEIKLDQVSYSSWLPDTDILVAQSLHKIYIWYKIERLHEPKVIDSRSCNLLKRAPLIDLSFAQSQSKTTRGFPEVVHLTAAGGILLSNSSSIPLDGLYIRFHREIIQLRLEATLRLLEKSEASEPRRVTLWAQLGWTAIRQEDLGTALRVFREISHASMVEYLSQCNQAETQEELRWRLAKLNGDWDAFEQLQDPETVLVTYKRLNKWSRCLEYLTKTQQFRQRDLCEQEHKQWLIGRGRYLEAARIQARQTGDLEGAIRLLVDQSNYEEAARLLLEEYKSSPGQINSTSTLFSSLKDHLVASGAFDLAAKMCQSVMGEPMEALRLFSRGELYDEALALAESCRLDQKQVNEIKREFAQRLLEKFKQNKLNRRQANRSIQLYLECDAQVEAIEAALDLNEPRKALDMLESMQTSGNTELEESRIAEYCERIASSLLSATTPVNQHAKSDAIRAYQMGKQYAKVVALSIAEHKFDEAFRVSLKYLHNQNEAATREEFKLLANSKVEQENDAQSAEQIYLLIGEVDLAIEMHRSRGNRERMLEIVEQHQPESVERYLLLLAKEMEQQGHLEEAERYLLRAGQDEWTNVVRMYRLANRWDDAYRVARQHCQSCKDPLLVQLAYFWAKSELASSPVVQVRELLSQRLDCLQEVLEFSCENKNFAFAIEMCRSDDGSDSAALLDERRRIVRRYANHLEKHQDLPKAERLLVQNDQLEDAVRMYLDNDLYLDAIRVIEEAQRSKSSTQDDKLAERLVGLLNRSLIEAANRITSQLEQRNGTARQIQLSASDNVDDDDAKQLALAQQMYLRAQKPDLAIEMYKSRGLWQEAIQVAQRFAPQLLEGVERDLDAQVSLDLKPIIDSRVGQSTQSSSRSSSLATSAQTLNGGSCGGGGGDGFVQLTPEAADKLLRARAEHSIRRGQDPRSTRRALGRLLTNLADGDPQNEASCLILGEKLAQLEQQPPAASLADQDTRRMLDSTMSQLFQVSCPLVCAATSEQQLSVWRRARNLQAKSLLAASGGGIPIPADELQQSERKLLALHYAVLHKCLADKVLQQLSIAPLAANGTNGKLHQSASFVMGPLAAERLQGGATAMGRAQVSGGQQEQLAPIVGLLAKLSMSLLRYSDSLDGRACFLSAGFWTLAANQAALARFAWSRLVELMDGGAGGSGGSGQWLSRLGRQLAQADCAQRVNVPPKSLVSAKYPALGEIRSWLIESLLENRASLDLSPLDEDGQLESSLRGGKFRPCLVSGYPVFSPDAGGQSARRANSWQVRQADWQLLKMLASSESAARGGDVHHQQKHSPVCPITECVQFIEWLMKVANQQQAQGLNKS